MHNALVDNGIGEARPTRDWGWRPVWQQSMPSAAKQCLCIRIE